MIKRSFPASIFFASIVLSSVLTAPAFAQSYGMMPRGACSKSTVKSSMARPQVHYQQVAHDDDAYAPPVSAPVRDAQRQRRAKRLGSPF